MWIDRLETTNFRNLFDGAVTFDKGLNWLVGANGQGKTNALEAIYFSLTTKSFRMSRLGDLVRDPSIACSLQLGLNRPLGRLSLTTRVVEGKTVRELGSKICRPIDLFRQTAIVAFTARSKVLVEGRPEDRRKFLDRMMIHLDPDYLNLLGQYRKIRGQLRQVLVQSQDLNLYRSFKKAATPVAEAIVERRLLFISQIIPRASFLYHQVFKGEGDLVLEYKIRQCDDFKRYSIKFMDSSAQELLYRKSMIGPQLDDLSIHVLKRRAKHYVSSGQIRAIVLSIKLAVRELYFEKHQCFPILVLDDLDAELDADRIQGLLDYLEDRGQTLISTSKYGTINGHRARILVVDAGRMSPERKGE